MKEPDYEFTARPAGAPHPGPLPVGRGEGEEGDGGAPWDESKDGEALLHQCCTDLGVNLPMALQIVGWADDQMPMRSAERGTRSAESELELVRKVEAKHRQAWHILIAYLHNQKTLGDAQMAARVMALELGYNTAAGADSVAALTKSLNAGKEKKHEVTKAAVNKCSVIFQTKLGLPLRPGQRDTVARKNMSEKRKGQLAP